MFSIVQCKHYISHDVHIKDVWHTADRSSHATLFSKKEKKRILTAGNDVVSNKRFDYCLELHVEGTRTHESFTAIDLLKKKWNSWIVTTKLLSLRRLASAIFNIGKRFPAVVVFNFILLLRQSTNEHHLLGGSRLLL